jgi:hypothetical protein
VTSFYGAFRASAKLDSEQRPPRRRRPNTGAFPASSGRIPGFFRSTTNQPQRANQARSLTEISLTRRQSSETRQSKSLGRVPRRVMRRAPRGPPDFSFPACHGGGPRHAHLAHHSRTPDPGPQEQHQGDIAARVSAWQVFFLFSGFCHRSTKFDVLSAWTQNGVRKKGYKKIDHLTDLPIEPGSKLTSNISTRVTICVLHRRTVGALSDFSETMYMFTTLPHATSTCNHATPVSHINFANADINSANAVASCAFFLELSSSFSA